VQLLISCSPKIAPVNIVQYLKGRSSQFLQEEYPELMRIYWGKSLWKKGFFCATVGSVSKEIISKYIERQEEKVSNETFTIEE